MRKLLCLLLLTSSAYAVSPIGDSIKQAAWYSTGIPDGGTAKVTGISTRSFINDGVQLISTNLPAYPLICTLSVTKGVSGYALPTDFDSLDWVLRLMGDSGYIPTEKSTPEAAYQKRQGVQGAVDDPVSWEDPRYSWTHGSRIFFYPSFSQTFGETDSMIVAYYAVAPSLDTLSDTTVIDPRYLPMLVDYVSGRIKEAQGDEYWAGWFYSKVPFMTFKVNK